MSSDGSSTFNLSREKRIGDNVLARRVILSTVSLVRGSVVKGGTKVMRNRATPLNIRNMEEEGERWRKAAGEEIWRKAYKVEGKEGMKIWKLGSRQN